MDARTRLEPERYLDVLHRDGERLLAVAEGHLDDAVPTCPGWSVGDLVDHVGAVYGHKIAALDAGRAPQPGEWTGCPAGVDVLSWCHGLLHGLSARLARRDAGAPAWTWWEPDQTVGFWQRRMALETAVHRVDVERATGEFTAVPADLAVDGVAEVLGVMLPDAAITDVDGPARVDRGVWLRIEGATVEGPADAVFLWLWGRRDDAAITVSGAQPADVRARLAEATQ